MTIEQSAVYEEPGVTATLDSGAEVASTVVTSFGRYVDWNGVGEGMAWNAETKTVTAPADAEYHVALSKETVDLTHANTPVVRYSFKIGKMGDRRWGIQRRWRV